MYKEEKEEWTNRRFDCCVSVSLEKCFSYLGDMVGYTNTEIG